MLAIIAWFAVAILVAKKFARKRPASARRDGSGSRLVSSLGIALIGASIQLGAASAADLKVTVQGVHPGPGSIRVALYANADSFRHEDRAFRVLSIPAKPDSIEIVFTDVPAGRYALLAYHDANDNKKLDLVLGMFPDEGWGLSNDPEVMGPPRFDPSAFDVVEPATNMSVRLHY